MLYQSAAITPLSVPDKKPQTLASVHELATKMETSFLAEMLRQADIGLTSKNQQNIVTNAFESFSSQALAQALANNGGIGLAQQIEKVLQQRVGETNV